MQDDKTLRYSMTMEPVQVTNKDALTNAAITQESQEAILVFITYFP